MREDDNLIRLAFHELTTDNDLFCQFDERHGVLLLNVENPFNDDDFRTILSIIDPYFVENGTLRGIIINSKKFPYWTSPHNRAQYLGFASQNHHKFKKIALCMNGFFPKIVLRVARNRIKGLIRIYKFNHIVEAQEWMLFKKPRKRKGLLRILD